MAFSIPALTTNFTPPAHCSETLTYYIPPLEGEFYTQSWVLQQDPYRVDTTCFPSGYKWNDGFFFEPGLYCPVGYYKAGLEAVGGPGSTKTYCCPSGYTTAYYVSGAAIYGCTSSYSSSTTGLSVESLAYTYTNEFGDPRTSYSTGASHTTRSVGPGLAVASLVVLINGPPDKRHALSSGAIVGIVVAALAVLFAVFGSAGVLCRRSRRRRGDAAAAAEKTSASGVNPSFGTMETLAAVQQLKNVPESTAVVAVESESTSVIPITENNVALMGSSKSENAAMAPGYRETEEYRPPYETAEITPQETSEIQRHI